MYFSYCPDAGFEIHDTALEAEKSAQDSLDYFRDNACDGWSEEVDGICWGTVSQDTQKVLEMSREDAEKEGILVSKDCCGFVDYSLVNTKSH